MVQPTPGLSVPDSCDWSGAHTNNWSFPSTWKLIEYTGVVNHLARAASNDAEARMVTFLCDTCGRVKKPEQQWILGSAAESLGAVSARREVNILSAWADSQAVHPLAVHFCSERCKDKYLNKLFSYGSAA